MCNTTINSDYYAEKGILSIYRKYIFFVFDILSYWDFITNK